jgi:hypothetical protein
MTMTTPPRPRFGEEFVAEWRRRWGGRPAHERPLTYDIAVEDEFADRRTWYGQQIDLLPEPEATEIADKLWREQHIWPCTLELATGTWLRAAGYQAAYEREWGNLTPDWTALHPDGRPAAFVEVHTDEPQQGVYGRIRRGAAWCSGSPQYPRPTCSPWQHPAATWHHRTRRPRRRSPLTCAARYCASSR